MSELLHGLGSVSSTLAEATEMVEAATAWCGTDTAAAAVLDSYLERLAEPDAAATIRAWSESPDDIADASETTVKARFISDAKAGKFRKLRLRPDEEQPYTFYTSEADPRYWAFGLLFALRSEGDRTPAPALPEPAEWGRLRADVRSFVAIVGEHQSSQGRPRSDSPPPPPTPPEEAIGSEHLELARKQLTIETFEWLKARQGHVCAELDAYLWGRLAAALSESVDDDQLALDIIVLCQRARDVAPPGDDALAPGSSATRLIVRQALDRDGLSHLSPVEVLRLVDMLERFACYVEHGPSAEDLRDLVVAICDVVFPKHTRRARP